MMWGYGPYGIFWMALFWIGVILLIGWVVRQGNTTSTARNSALEVLEERFARGEIDGQEFESRRRELQKVNA